MKTDTQHVHRGLILPLHRSPKPYICATLLFAWEEISAWLFLNRWYWILGCMTSNEHPSAALPLGRANVGLGPSEMRSPGLRRA
jgi:hypothetical protein